MTCSEFQKVLPYIIETGGNAEEEAHLKSCAVCSDLVQDLTYIAEQAKLLVPMVDPGPRVWFGIKNALEREGLVRPGRGTARFRPQAVLMPWRRSTVGGLVAIAALLLVAVGLLTYRNGSVGRSLPLTPAPPAPVQPAMQSAGVEDDDSQLLSLLQKMSPATAASYQENLKSVNAYISDARRTVQQNPADQQARDYLLRAYDEKAMIYEMALARTLQ